jgi:hypothetical protein
MSLKDMFSAEEWNNLTNAPLAAGLYISNGEPHPFHMLEDMMAMSKAVHDADSSIYLNPLIREILEEKLGTERYDIIPATEQILRDNKPPMPSSELESNAGKAKPEKNLEIIRRAGAAVARMPGQDADEYKRWVMSVAQKVAEASKEGGFLGFGGKRVSEEEKTSLREIAEAIGYKG